ncbi:unnamed protein product [Owenia fusiformis]|uniref:VWFA domain-containing protein n=1 Tax=Owenia fusiformis TaxID=6347 RepID=A0A8S4NCE4_OWEFU|nr:unnamed protein product [Owenia fusiformis]
MDNYLCLNHIICWIILTSSLTIEGARKYSAPGRTSTSRCGLGPTRYLAAPEINPGEGDICNYFACERGIYRLKSCPKGFGVHRKFMKIGRRGIAQNTFPCIIRTSACKRTVLNDIVSAAGTNSSNTSSSTNTLDKIPFIPKVAFCGIDLAIAVDISCSIAIEDKILVKKFVTDLIKRLKIGTGFVKVAGLTFGSEVFPIQFFDESRSTQATNYNFERMKLVDKRCRTHTDEAMELIRDHIFTKARGDRPDKKNFLILTSDGNTYHGRTSDNSMYKERTKAAGRDIRAKGTETFVVGLPTKKKGKITGMDEWMEIGGDENHVFLLESFNQLSAKIDELISASCKDSEFNFWDR